MILKEVFARKIKDSRRESTIEVQINGISASSPSGKSTGKHETRPYNKDLEWNINFLNSWNEEVEIERFDDLVKAEKIIEKKIRKNAKQFGANALFAFESAILKALAKEKKKQLWQVINLNAKKFPHPVGNAVGGGLHSERFKVHPDFQEFLVIPKSSGFSQEVKIMNYFYNEIGKLLNSKEKNDEGAWQSAITNEEALNAMNEVKKKTTDKFKVKIEIGIDAAASSLYKKEIYDYHGWKISREKQIKYMQGLTLNYDLFYIEDPVEEEDFKGFTEINKNSEKLIVGDDLTATQIDRLKKAIKMKSINAMIIKPNQNGSLLELREIFDICKKHGIKTVMSHRSGETEDNALADYAFGFGADYIKCGISGLERKAKLKRMEEIERTIR